MSLNKHIRYFDACTVRIFNIKCASVGCNKTKTDMLFLINLSVSHRTWCFEHVYWNVSHISFVCCHRCRGFKIYIFL